MNRRDLMALLGGAAAWPVVARAQQEGLPVVGYLSASNSATAPMAAFHQGLKELGYVGGQNIAIEYRWAEGRYDRLPALAADLVTHRVAVLAANPLPAALAAKAASTTIPIVFMIGGDPVQTGLVNSLNRPGGNLTGSTFFTGAVITKRLELLLELVPKPTLVGVLGNPANPTAVGDTNGVRAAASALSQRIHVLNASTPGEIDAAFATLVMEHAGALLIGNDPFLNTRRDQLALLAARHAIPTIYPLREYVSAGGLMSYGTDVNDSARQQGLYVGRILKGDKPNDLPVVQPTKFEFIVNLKTAKALGITIPPNLLAIADEVIE